MATTPDALFLAFQGALAGRYSIDRELGRGGMGVVYLAREVHLDRPVAIKVLPPERAQDRTLRERFLREARLAAKLSHPNIIPIFSVEETGGFVYFVMAFIDGQTVTDRVRTRGPLPANDGTRVLREIAWALAYAHEQGLIHRDVKPDNIILEESTGRVMVADFGIAAAAGDTSDGVSGTPEFMSPEQALGTALDARSDVYGLGATAFYMFSGKFAFEGKTSTEVLAKQVTQPAPSLSSLGLSVPRKLGALIDRCLAKAPENRPENAKVLAEQLGAALDRRREMPPALRAFVKRTSRLDGPGTLLAAGVLSTGTAVSIMVATYAHSGYGYLGIAGMLGVAIAAPFAAFVDAARDLVKRGFTHRDVVVGYEALVAQAREEMIAADESKVRMRRVLALLFRVTTSIVGLELAGAWFDALGSWAVRTFGSVWVMGFNAFAGICAVIALFAGVGYVILKDQTQGPDGSWWAKIWGGRIGQAAFRFASRLSKGVTTSALTHRATELSLGMAAEQLFESLPKATRNQLSDVPATLKHLQAAAQELRKRHDSLAEALSDAGEAAVGADYADIRELRDELHDRLRDAVGALETIRLNLLRLHAGSLSVESVTTQLGIVADVAEEVDRLLAAQNEVDRALRFPRTPESTPV